MYDILTLNEEKLTVKVEPMVTVGEITKYLIPKGKGSVITNYPVKLIDRTRAEVSVIY